MSSLITIQMNFDRARKQADDLDRAAAKLESLANNDLEGVLGGIRRNWKGENADAYAAKGGKVKTDMQNLAKDLRKTAAVVRSIARTTYDAERRAYEIATTVGQG